jgi:hypothetical protein
MKHSVTNTLLQARISRIFTNNPVSLQSGVLDVLDSNLVGVVDSNISVDSATLLEIDNSSTAQTLSSTSCPRC